MGNWDPEEPTERGDWRVGASLTGAFDKFQRPIDPYAQMRPAEVDDRRGEEWPTAVLPTKKFLDQTPTGTEKTDKIMDLLDAMGITDIAPATRLGIDAGIHDINAPSKEDMMKFLMTNEATGPDPAPTARVPLPRRRPRDAR